MLILEAGAVFAYPILIKNRSVTLLQLINVHRANLSVPNSSRSDWLRQFFF